ncbi:hypothetical protein, partial [Burkholderia multivorans]|uniref:hypothetical protein n=1 Tax=Burkholderia multivorans TaxID=87883 RepID=UPI001EE653F9
MASFDRKTDSGARDARAGMPERYPSRARPDATHLRFTGTKLRARGGERKPGSGKRAVKGGKRKVESERWKAKGGKRESGRPMVTGEWRPAKGA